MKTITFIGICGFVILMMSLLLLLVNTIPNDPIRKNVALSISPVNYQPSPFGPVIRLDNYTECIAASMGLGPNKDILGVIQQSFLSPNLGDCEEQKGTSINKEIIDTNYWRYWHGYQLFSRPILYFSDVYKLRLFNFIIFCLSLFFFCLQLHKVAGKKYVWIILVSFICAPLYSQLFLITHGLVWAIGFLAGGILLYLSGSNRLAISHQYIYYIFFFIGMICAFFDLLTNPTVTLTIPLLALYWSKSLPSGIDISQRLTRTLMIPIAWAFGYAICWAMKWVLAATILGINPVLNDLVNNITLRLGGAGAFMKREDVTALNSILINLKRCISGLVILFLISVLRAKFIINNLITKQLSFEQAITSFFLFMIPFIWLMVVRNHSIEHAWFVAPILFPSFALVLGWILAPDKPHNELFKARMLTGFRDTEPASGP